ncbi:ATP-binding protein [Pseudomonas sp. C11]|uniref:ATP-binding protein n=1 Tax=Pseudomonas sp. C11 TaxID=3075550 RepID=UPI002AFFF9EE|nr:ATP-binding protein [Pseudomonas sp. C11]
MAKVPFKVSARAARLIGRENVATSQGAVTELVKNAYDADASACAILFIPRWERAPEVISGKQFTELEIFLPNAKDYYLLVDEEKTERVLCPDISELSLAKLNAAFQNVLDLWIIDNGHGMSIKVIEDHWMVIGTDAKEVQDTSVGGRVVTGAKGIGRFALDRLGHECELFSAELQGGKVAHWLVDWDNFEGDGKVLDDVQAILDDQPGTLADVYGMANARGYLPKIGPAEDGEEGLPLHFDHGTAIKIAHLHDVWDQRDSSKLKQTLEALLPPKERGDFNIYIYDHRTIFGNGWIDNLPPDQFDYRLKAQVKAKGEVDITVERKEIDPHRIRSSVFDIKAMQKPGFLQEDFKRGSYSYSTSLHSLLKLSSDEEGRDVLAIGPFDFSLYFFKLSNPTEDNLERYPQKNFDVTKRRRWLQNSGGVRIYRDGFRVRPYGEPNTQGSDWLLLGQRVAANPAAAKRIGWRVPPQQLAGTINITKSDNPLLADQSNREGIMNERAFSVFRRIILALIGEFERDRSFIYNNFDQAYENDHAEEVEVEEGRQLAENILAGVSQTSPLSGQLGLEMPSPEASTKSDEDLLSDNIKIAKAYKSEERKNEALKDEIQVMRGLATLGTVLVSFTHELKQIKANMESRYTRMDNALKRVVDEDKIRSLPEQVNPFNIVGRWGREDEKVSRWVDFALSAVSPTKRRRRVINAAEYFMGLSEYWKDFLKSRDVSLDVSCDDKSPTLILAHEIDLDSIFYNLLVNSVEAFIRPSHESSRDISIDICKLDGQVEIVYKDTGPGISDGFGSAEDIFMFGTSSKATEDSAGVTGTGIGMWLVKGIVDDYGGSVALLSGLGDVNFSLVIKLPLHNKL